MLGDDRTASPVHEGDRDGAERSRRGRLGVQGETDQCKYNEQGDLVNSMRTDR